MKAICIKRPHPWNVTKGKIYDLYDYTYTNDFNLDKWLIDDKGEVFLFVNGLEPYLDYFITLEQWRDMKLNEIGI
jgi:hypothetical protein